MGKRRKRTNKNVPAKGRLNDMADRLWSLAIRSDWGWKCAVCGAVKVEAHHLIPREHYATRYDLKNGIALCANHHKFDPDVSPHQNAGGWIFWITEHRPTVSRWLADMIESGEHRQFTGTKNAAYFCGVIRGLRQYVEQEEFERVCGIKFSQWLEQNE